jgi:hypothetical protein
VGGAGAVVCAAILSVHGVRLRRGKLTRP